ncbi:GPO family capsid scaffolding protein [Mannheimia bovis]|uniref:GPO family capsid scaffolding protein n=2 Tax=Mannheimia bovis TaxID=2770636 RepID=A0A7H1BZW9_9PAST|nr:GPO family capsid scaffolding protein [Mannheimia bovis]
MRALTDFNLIKAVMTTVSKSKLRTDFICIATSGTTVDGREITKQELLDMAETYSTDLYTANMWPEHRRWFNFGQVLEVKVEEVSGELKLFAVLAPNDHLISWNKDGQYLFTSIEITPNFRGSGKSYLTGLGVTDSPASVGTTQLQFNIKDAPQNTVAGEYTQINLALNDKQNDEEKSFFNMVKAFFTQHSEKEPETTQIIPQNNNNKEEKTMDEKQFSQLLNAVNGLGEKVEKYFTQTPATPAPEPAPKPEEPAQAQGITTEQFNQLSSAVSELNKKFDALAEVKTPVPGGVPETKEFNTAV